jgi:nitroimidazol reductase NimA-like FMN-containing flavoprotein (pyridoxamine 5'-phosphate oxidase superfamily)
MAENHSDVHPASTRTTVRRGAKRAEYDRATLLEILRVGTVAHVGVVTESGPLVLPMVYGITDDTMYLHGALANSLLGSSVDMEICATVTIVDGLVFAKTPFNHSMNYRSVVVRGQARLVTDNDEILRSLQLMTDHVVSTWDVMRHPSPSEIRATKVVALSLEEMSGKVRSGGAVNDEEDESAPYWSGFVPLVSSLGQPVTNEDAGDIVPESVRNLAGQDIHARARLDS